MVAVVAKLIKICLEFLRRYRAKRLRREFTRDNIVGRDVNWELTSEEAWELIAMKNTPGWGVFFAQQLGLVNEAIEYMGGAREMDELHYRRGFKDGVMKTVQILDKLLKVAVEDEELIRRAQKLLKVESGGGE